MRDAPYSSGRNSFHLARFVLALLAILANSYALRSLVTPLSRLTSGQLNEGTLAANAFLVISGFLICQSSVRTRNVLVFLRNRILRILPALLFALVFSALIIGGLAYSGTFAQYLQLQDDGPFSWMWSWLTLNIAGEQASISGVFAGNAFPALNANLWTLRHLASLYLLMAVLILTTLNCKRPTYIVLYTFFLILHVLQAGFGIRLWNATDPRFWVLSHQHYPQFVETGLYFFSGTLLYAYRDRMPRRWYFAVIAIMALVLGGCFGFLQAVSVVAIPYLICYLAASPLCSGFARIGDLSLGMYLYSFPIQQMICHVAPAWHPLPSFVATLLLVLPLSLWSRKRIEEPALRLKSPRP